MEYVEVDPREVSQSPMDNEKVTFGPYIHKTFLEVFQNHKDYCHMILNSPQVSEDVSEGKSLYFKTYLREKFRPRFNVLPEDIIHSSSVDDMINKFSPKHIEIFEKIVGKPSIFDCKVHGSCPNMNICTFLEIFYDMFAKKYIMNRSGSAASNVYWLKCFNTFPLDPFCQTNYSIRVKACVTDEFVDDIYSYLSGLSSLPVSKMMTENLMLTFFDVICRRKYKVLFMSAMEENRFDGIRLGGNKPCLVRQSEFRGRDKAYLRFSYSNATGYKESYMVLQEALDYLFAEWSRRTDQTREKNFLKLRSFDYTALYKTARALYMAHHLTLPSILETEDGIELYTKTVLAQNNRDLLSLVDDDYRREFTDEYRDKFKRYFVQFCYCRSAGERSKPGLVHELHSITLPIVLKYGQNIEYRNILHFVDDILQIAVVAGSERLDADGIRGNLINSDYLRDMMRYCDKYASGCEVSVDRMFRKDNMKYKVGIVSDNRILEIQLSSHSKNRTVDFYKLIISGALYGVDHHKLIIYNPFLGEETFMNMISNSDDVIAFLKAFYVND